MEILYHFHLTPAQQDELTYWQFLDLIEACKKIREENSK